MSVLDRIAYFQNRRDEAPNQALAKELAEKKDKAGIREIAKNLWNDNPEIQSDCVKVLYEVGALEPRLIAAYSADFLKLLSSQQNRLVWGGMTALAAIAPVSAGKLFARWEDIRQATEAGSVITTDNGIKALAAIAASGDARRQGRVFSYLAQSFRLRGDYDGAIESGQKAIDIGRDFDDLGIQAPANFHLGQAFFHLGDHGRAEEFQSNNIRMLIGDLSKDRLGMAGIPLVFSRGYLSWSLAELGRFPEAIEAWRQAIQLAEEVKHPFSEAFAKYCGGFLYLRKGEIERAIAQLEPGFALCQSMHLRLELPFVASFLGIAYAYEGRHSEGIAIAEQAVNEMHALKIESGRSWILGFLGYTYLIAGQTAKATELMQQALDLAQLHGEHGWVAWEHHVLGLARMAEGGAGIEKAHNLFKQAIEEATALQLRPLLARSELALGQLHRRAGREDSARQNLVNAVSLLKEMQMPFWLRKAETELQALD